MQKPTRVISYNLDMRQAYVYDLTSDHNYCPYDPSMPTDGMYVDYQSFPTSRERFRLPSCREFCLLEEFYFFRTILESEARSPTVVMHPDRSYQRLLTFAEFLDWFSKTYKVIYWRWRALEPSIEKPEESPSMRAMFHLENDDATYTFREWMNRVCMKHNPR